MSPADRRRLKHHAWDNIVLARIYRTVGQPATARRYLAIARLARMLAADR